MKYATLDQIYDTPYCPVDDFTCPYFNSDNGRCMMDVMEGCPPYDECDAFDEYEEEMPEDGFYEFDCGKFGYDEMAANP